MPIPPADGTIWNNAGAYVQPPSPNGNWGHRTFVSPSCGGVTVGYVYRLPDTFSTEPTRKFPVLYFQDGGGSDENFLIVGGDAGTQAIAPDPQGDLSSAMWNWGPTAKCILIGFNGTRTEQGVEAMAGSTMGGVVEMQSQMQELINEVETNFIPTRCVPQGWSDANGYKGRGIAGVSGGGRGVFRLAYNNPTKYAAAYVFASATIGDQLPWPGVFPGGDPQYWTPDAAGHTNYLTTLPQNIIPAQAGAVNATPLFTHGQTCTGDPNHSNNVSLWSQLSSNGIAHDPLDEPANSFHTAICYITPLMPWFVGKCFLQPTCNGPSGLTTVMNTALHVSSATVVANDTDPQLLTLQVASVSSPTHGTVTLTGGLGGTVNFTPTTGFTGTASFNYTAQNTDGQTNTGTASINVTPAIATITFPLVAFSATGASTPRTMPDRLNDVINVKDQGAVGDGVNDDSAAIQRAIDRAFSVSGNAGGRVFLPPGIYNVGTTGIRLTSPSFAGAQALQLVGAGKRASIIKGNNATAILSDFSPDAKVELIRNLTVWNQSTTANSAAILFDGGGIDNRCRFDNLRLIGMFGVDCQQNAFNVAWMNCDAICSASIGANPDILTIPAASSGAQGPVAGTIGFYIGQWSVYNCSATGFDVGFAMTNAGGPMFAGNRAYRCNTGFYGGISHGGQGTMDGNVYGCLAERCGIGILALNTSGAIIAGNVVSGEVGSDINTAVSPSSGPAEPAAIQSMSWNAGSHLVTVTTLANHNLAAGTQKLSLALAPSSWYPVGNTDGLISCTNTGANTFTYAGPTSNPAPFSAGTWNYPMNVDLISSTTLGSTFAANSVDAPASRVSVDMAPQVGFQYQSCAVMAMNGKYGWNFPPGDSGSGPCNIYLLQIGTDFPTIVSTATGGVEEVIFSDGQPGLGFNAVFVGGGSTQYKARRTGANFAVIG